MTPALTTFDVADSGLVNTILGCKLPLSCAIATNGNYGNTAELSKGVLLTSIAQMCGGRQ